MKESISAVSIFQIVILFILLFTAIMCLTINNANAFGIKDELTNIIEQSNGEFLEGNNLSKEIVSTIDNSAYRTTGKCDEGYTGFQRDGSRVQSGSTASICIKCVPVSNEIEKNLTQVFGNFAPQSSKVKSFYYQIVVFYQLDIPVVKQVYDFKTKGETRLLYNDVAGLCN